MGVNPYIGEAELLTRFEGTGFSSPLWQALMRKEENKVRLMLDAGADPTVKNRRDEEHLVPASTWLPAFVPELIQRGCDPNHIDQGGTTPLGHVIGSRGNSIAIELLVGHGADPNMPTRTYHDRHPKTPLIRAMESNYDLVLPLLKHGAHPAGYPVIDGRSFTAMTWAAFFRKPDILQALVEVGANILEKDGKDKTALDLYTHGPLRGMLEAAFDKATLNQALPAHRPASRPSRL